MKEIERDDFVFIDFERSPRGAKIKERQIAMSNRPKKKWLTLSADISAEIYAINPCKLRVRLDKITGDVHFIFNSDNGLEINRRDPEGAVKNVVIQNLDLSDWMAKQFKIGKDAERATFSCSQNISNSQEYVTYKITYNPN